MGEIHRDFADAPAEGFQGRFSFASGATTLIYRLGGPLRSLRNEVSPCGSARDCGPPPEKIVDGLVERNVRSGAHLVTLGTAGPDDIAAIHQEELLFIRPSTSRWTTDSAVATIPGRKKWRPRLISCSIRRAATCGALIDRYFRDLGIPSHRSSWRPMIPR